MKHWIKEKQDRLKIMVEPQTIRIIDGHIGSAAAIVAVEGNVIKITPTICTENHHKVFPQCRECQRFRCGCRKINKVAFGYGEEVIINTEEIVAKLGINSWAKPRTCVAHWNGDSYIVLFKRR